MAAFGTQIAARVALALRAPVSVRHQWASPQHSSSKLVLCIRLAPLVGSRALRGYHRFGRIFYLLHLLNLREAFAAWLCFGTQIITDLEGFLSAPSA